MEEHVIKEGKEKIFFQNIYYQFIFATRL